MFGTTPVRASLAVTPVQAARTASLDLSESAGGATLPAAAYLIDMTKPLHLIVVDDALAVFMHVHPELDANGHFHMLLRLPHPGRYHVYADAQLARYGHRVFRFDIAIGNGKRVVPTFGAPARSVAIMGYTVSLDRTSLPAGADAVVRVAIDKNGRLARDLHPFLGAAAHAVFIHAGDLTYVHVHPMGAGGMDMPNMPSDQPNKLEPAQLALHVTLPERGAYKMWLEFRGGAEDIAAPFVIVAK